MSKEQFLKIYIKISIFIGLMLLISIFVYTTNFVKDFNVLVDKSVFRLTLENYQGDIHIFNSPLVMYISVLVLNVFLMFRVGNLDELENKGLQGILVYNTLIVLMMIIGQIVFFIMIPDRINGITQDLFVFLKMPLRSNEFVNVINVNYILSLVYIGYNVFLSIRNLPEKTVEVIDEEIYEAEIITELEKEE